MSERKTLRSSRPSASCAPRNTPKVPDRPATSDPSAACVAVAESSNASPLFLANRPSATRSASFVPCKISEATRKSTSIMPVPLGRSGAPTPESTALAAAWLRRKCCSSASSKPALARKSSSTSCAIAGRKDAASAALAAGRARACEVSSASSESLPADELLALMCVASSMPGKGWGPNRPVLVSPTRCVKSVDLEVRMSERSR
mmetsp:Transcript_51374/g.119409  ORF Transcript_51374/g.119409 Transcript_51374/m.119409 type:complete len:204 (+) Transcript_51374:305-916(+)